MRRLDDSFITLGEDLEREAQRLRGVSQVMPDGPEREEILQMARAAETRRVIKRWLSSAELQPTK